MEKKTPVEQFSTNNIDEEKNKKSSASSKKISKRCIFTIVIIFVIIILCAAIVGIVIVVSEKEENGNEEEKLKINLKTTKTAQISPILVKNLNSIDFLQEKVGVVENKTLNEIFHSNTTFLVSNSSVEAIEHEEEINSTEIFNFETNFNETRSSDENSTLTANFEEILNFTLTIEKTLPASTSTRTMTSTLERSTTGTSTTKPIIIYDCSDDQIKNPRQLNLRKKDGNIYKLICHGAETRILQYATADPVYFLDQTLQDYVDGFGSIDTSEDSSYFFGFKNIIELMSNKPLAKWTLNITMKPSNKPAFSAIYDDFSMDTSYRLSVGNYEGSMENNVFSCPFPGYSGIKNTEFKVNHPVCSGEIDAFWGAQSNGWWYGNETCGQLLPMLDIWEGYVAIMISCSQENSEKMVKNTAVEYKELVQLTFDLTPKIIPTTAAPKFSCNDFTNYGDRLEEIAFGKVQCLDKWTRVLSYKNYDPVNLLENNLTDFVNGFGIVRNDEYTSYFIGFRKLRQILHSLRPTSTATLRIGINTHMTGDIFVEYNNFTLTSDYQLIFHSFYGTPDYNFLNCPLQGFANQNNSKFILQDEDSANCTGIFPSYHYMQSNGWWYSSHDQNCGNLRPMMELDINFGVAVFTPCTVPNSRKILNNEQADNVYALKLTLDIK